ncbi:MAG: ubiquinone/menaquinone biosynthesis methyltransferase [Candidatus Limnocylindrales bacterium]
MERRGNTVGQADVTEMFDAIAPVYDRLNTVMTLRSDGRWRRRAARAAGLAPGERAVDVACGTGKLSVELAHLVGPFGNVEGVDLSAAMLERAAREHRALVQLHFQVGDALALPFDDDTFDAATIAFGLRNLPDFAAGFREMARVVRPGGRVVCLELSRPPAGLWARAYQGLFRWLAPTAARLLGGRVAAYGYLPASLEGFPTAESLAETMRSGGLAQVRFWRLSTGIAVIHRGIVPG